MNTVCMNKLEKNHAFFEMSANTKQLKTKA